MSTDSAAPGGGTPGHGYIVGNASTLSHLGLSAPIISRLAAEGVTSLRDWRGLGRRRFQIFGITTSTVKKIDGLAREARE